MKLSLMVLNAGKASGQAIPITVPQFVIGRDPKCNLRPASAMISKQHCAVIIKDGKVYLKDFDSTNGSFVNDKQIKGAVVLNNNDVVKVGPLTFKVTIEGQAAINKPTPPPKPKAAVGEEDPAAALLLSLDDEDVGGPMVSTTEDPAEVPGGSTIMEMPVVISPTAAAEEPTKVVQDDKTTAEPKAEKKPEEKKPAPGTAQLAAQAILERYKKGLRKG